MRTAEQLRQALHKLEYQALSDSTEDGIKKIIENDNDEMHHAHSILIGIGSLRSQSSLAITESDLQDKAYQCIIDINSKVSTLFRISRWHRKYFKHIIFN